MEFVLELWEYVDPQTIVFSKYLVIATVLGFFIGMERESRHKDAGISTHILVICGAMLFTFFSTGNTADSEARIAAQIVTGIGFLGAGLILKDGTTVRNLTTAASIWYAGAIGMAIGFGYWQIAIVATLAALLIPRIPHFQKQATEITDPQNLVCVPKAETEAPSPSPERKLVKKKRLVKRLVKKAPKK